MERLIVLGALERRRPKGLSSTRGTEQVQPLTGLGFLESVLVIKDKEDWKKQYRLRPHSIITNTLSGVNKLGERRIEKEFSIFSNTF